MRSATFNTSVKFTAGNLSIPTPVLPSSCTVACFFQRTVAGNGQVLIAIGGDALGVPNSYLALLDFTTLQLGTNDGGSFPAVTTLVTNTWYFGAFTGNGTTGVGYAIPTHGAVATATDTGIIATLPQNLNVSNDDEADGNWQGNIAGVKAWPFPLSETEILREATQLAPVVQGELVYLPLRNSSRAALDERTGTFWTTGGSLTTVFLSPNVPELLHRRVFSYASALPPTANAPFFGTD